MSSADLLERVKRAEIIQPGEHIVVAVSGGPDSVCLALLLNELAKHMELKLHLAHLNHCFRGAEAEADADFVMKLGDRLGWPVTVETIDVPGILRQEGGSPQAVSRKLRYDFLKQVASQTGSSVIALGHNKNDQAETFLINLLRGAGTTGLAAMAEREHIGDGIVLLRPLLSVTRKEILSYLEHKQQPFRVDRSNLQDKYLRNHIRHHLLPFIEQHYNPAIVNRLYDTAAILREEDEYLRCVTSRVVHKCLHKKDNAVILSCKEYGALHPALQKRILRTAYCWVRGSVLDITARHIQDLQRLVQGSHGRRIELPAGVICEKVYNTAVFYFNTEFHDYCKELMVPGRTWVRDGWIITEIKPKERVVLTDNPYYAFLDLGAVGSKLYVRTRKPGDVFQPLGMQGSKKLKDFFIDLKVPRYLRDAVPLVVTANDEIVWVVPYRIGQPFRVTDITQHVLECRFERSSCDA